MTEHDPKDDAVGFLSGEDRSVKRSDWVWTFVIAGTAFVIVVYLILVPFPFAGLAARPLVAGWEALQACGTMRSADGSREIEFHENRTGVLREASAERDEDETSNGLEIKWEYGLNRYSITVTGAKESYSLLSVDSPGICILIKGDVASADLRGSWFASRVATPDPDSSQD